MWWADWWGGYGAMPWMAFGPLAMLVVIGVFVAMVYLALRGSGAQEGREARAVEILKERYARGEIDQAEFEKRRRILRAAPDV
jgi:putative membrane protein